MFSLKILGLLMCRDRIETKEGMLADLIRQNQQEIEIGNPRLRRAIKLIIYFSEIVPKQYHREIFTDSSRNLLSHNGFGDL